MKNLPRTLQARNEKVSAHRYVSKLLNWYQPNNKCDFDKCSYRTQKLWCFEEWNNSASRYPTAKLMFDSRFHVYFGASPSFYFLLYLPAQGRLGTEELILSAQNCNSLLQHRPWTLGRAVVAYGPWTPGPAARDEFQREEITAGQIQYAHRQRKIFF